VEKVRIQNSFIHLKLAFGNGSVWHWHGVAERSAVRAIRYQRRRVMLETIAVVLVLLWLLGLVSSYTLGGFIHLLLVLAIVVILIRLIQGRRAL
jgi:hypothetical protein